jgi:hypothetical protein
MNVKFEKASLLLTNLNKGMYLLYITTEDGQTNLRKFLKE